MEKHNIKVVWHNGNDTVKKNIPVKIYDIENYKVIEYFFESMIPDIENMTMPNKDMSNLVSYGQYIETKKSIKSITFYSLKNIHLKIRSLNSRQIKSLSDNGYIVKAICGDTVIIGIGF